LNSRLAAVAVVGVVELELELGHNLGALLEQEIVMRRDMLVEVVESGPAGWMLRVR